MITVRSGYQSTMTVVKDCPWSPESTLALFCQTDSLKTSHFSYFIGPRVSAVLRKYHSNEIIWFINPV